MRAISISYKLCPISVRQKFVINEQDREDFISYIRKSVSDIREIVILSTCNRLEIYFDDGVSVQDMSIILCKYLQVSYYEYSGYINRYQERDAIHHLIRVVCGIDSMVIGDDDITRQVKDAYNYSLENGLTYHEFNIIFQKSFEASKSIKTGSGLSQVPVSVATLTAHEVLERVASGNLPRVLIFGITGKTGGMVAKSLLESGKVLVTGTYRTHAHARLPFVVQPNQTERLSMIPYADRYEAIRDADVIISATTSPHLVVTHVEYERHIHDDGERLFIDLAVPPDIDSDIAGISGCSYINIDYFDKIASENNHEKFRLAQAAEQSIDEWTDDIIMDLTMRSLAEMTPDINKYIEQNGGIDEMIHALRKSQDVDVVRHIEEWLCMFLAVDK